MEETKKEKIVESNSTKREMKNGKTRVKRNKRKI